MEFGKSKSHPNPVLGNFKNNVHCDTINFFIQHEINLFFKIILKRFLFGAFGGNRDLCD